MFCTKCGNKNLADARFCEKCGHAIHLIEATPDKIKPLETTEYRRERWYETWIFRMIVLSAMLSIIIPALFLFWNPRNLKILNLWITSWASILVIHTTVSLYIKERNIGWRRLAIIAGVLLAIGSGLFAFIESRSTEKIIKVLIFSTGGFVIGTLLVLWVRSVVKWVRAGFIDTAQSIRKK
jgi:hypothetical protein